MIDLNNFQSINLSRFSQISIRIRIRIPFLVIVYYEVMFYMLMVLMKFSFLPQNFFRFLLSHHIRSMSKERKYCNRVSEKKNLSFWRMFMFCMSQKSKQAKKNSVRPSVRLSVWLYIRTWTFACIEFGSNRLRCSNFSRFRFYWKFALNCLNCANFKLSSSNLVRECTSTRVSFMRNFIENR